MEKRLLATSLSRLAGFGVAGASTLIGSALFFRQRSNKNSPILDATAQQLKSSDKVQQLLGAQISKQVQVLRAPL